MSEPSLLCHLRNLRVIRRNFPACSSATPNKSTQSRFHTLTLSTLTLVVYDPQVYFTLLQSRLTNAATKMGLLD
jgi:hypothetical protein